MKLRRSEITALRNRAKELCDKYKIDELVQELKSYDEARFTEGEIGFRFAMRTWHNLESKFKYE